MTEPDTRRNNAGDQQTSSMKDVLRGAPDPEIIALEEALRSAQLAADMPLLDRLIADQLLFTGPDGQLAALPGAVDACDDIQTRALRATAGGYHRARADMSRPLGGVTPCASASA